MSTRTASRSRTGRHTGFREGQISFFPCELNASERPIDLLHGGCGKGDWKQRPKAPLGTLSAFSTHFKPTAAPILRNPSFALLHSTSHSIPFETTTRTSPQVHLQLCSSTETNSHSLQDRKCTLFSPFSHISLSFPSITSFRDHSSKTLIQILVFYSMGMS